jgi:hypothetical protein
VQRGHRFDAVRGTGLFGAIRYLARAINFYPPGLTQISRLGGGMIAIGGLQQLLGAK